jgi:hypothetical protein
MPIAYDNCNTMVINIFFTIVMFKVIKWGMHVYCALNSSLSKFVTYRMWIAKNKENVTRDSALKENETRNQKQVSQHFA